MSLEGVLTLLHDFKAHKRMATSSNLNFMGDEMNYGDEYQFVNKTPKYNFWFSGGMLTLR